MTLARRVVGTFAAALVVLAAPGIAEAKNQPAPKPKPPAKVAVCEQDDDGAGGWELEMVSAKAVARKLKEGAHLPGDAVPGMTGYVFGPDCIPVATKSPQQLACEALGGTYSDTVGVVTTGGPALVFSCAGGVDFGDPAIGFSFYLDVCVPAGGNTLAANFLGADCLR